MSRVFAGMLALFGLGAAQAATLAVGDLAPAFDLPDQANRHHRLADYRGHWVLLYFYPKDDTPGCTTEACNFRDDISRITALGATVIGVSIDSTESHARFAEKYHLPFPLLADRGGDTARAYGSLTSFGPFTFAKRHSFIIDPDGRIAKIYRDVSPATHSRDIQRDLKALQQAAH